MCLYTHIPFNVQPEDGFLRSETCGFEFLKKENNVVLNCILILRMGEERGCIGSWWGNRRERDHWGDLGVDGWIILGWISKRWNLGIWTGLGWPRIETVGGRL